MAFTVCLDEVTPTDGLIDRSVSANQETPVSSADPCGPEPDAGSRGSDERSTRLDSSGRIRCSRSSLQSLLDLQRPGTIVPEEEEEDHRRAQRWTALDGLQWNCSGSVEVQAVSFWGQRRLKSAKASVHIDTQQHTQSKAVSKARKVPVKKSSSALGVGTPYYKNGELQVRIYWKKRTDVSGNRYHVQWKHEYCNHNQSRAAEKSVTQENYINLPNLLFSCMYTVTVHTLGARQRSSDESIGFLTPSCEIIRSKSPKPIACPGDQGRLHRTVPAKVSAQPENLTATFTLHDGNVTGHFRWRGSRPQSHQPITGFQVTWAEFSTESRQNSLPNSIISQSQILPPNQNLLVVSNLRPGTFYRVDVHVITATGEGPATKRVFLTPSRPPIQQKAQLHQHHHQKSSVEKH
ncbi:anosmin-1-like [Pimephales promelas]|uniref:anosmin-1-like n=1 Tax=Pimephales promelas TaxID=90988 RepID=UPI001955DD42|nr:anosmin-1-like [Pimephales promelas]